jgi:hypothetical protein
MTYQVNRTQYANAPYFIWQAPQGEPELHHEVMRDYYRWEASEFERNRTWRGFLERGFEKVVSGWQFYLGPLLTIPLLALPWIIGQRRMRLPLVICVAMIAGLAVQTWTFPHYFAPATGALYLIIVQGLRHLRLWQGERGTGRDLVRAVPVLACAMIVLRVTAAASHTPIEPAWPRGNLERVALVRELNEMPGQHLVVVRYGTHHDIHREWVWNEASIDSAKIVWARDMGQARNIELVRYFAHRRVWQINADDTPPKLIPSPFEPASGTR